MSRLSRTVCGLLLGALTAREANAQQVTPPFLEYAAKFACGQVQRNEAGGGDTDAVVGIYATSINIHNPQTGISVPFVKKVVIANPEGQSPGRFKAVNDKLLPDQAELVDCSIISRLLDISPGPHVEGFVVLEVPITPDQPQLSLDVVGKYSARPSTGEVSSVDVVVYSPKQISQ